MMMDGRVDREAAKLVVKPADDDDDDDDDGDDGGQSRTKVSAID